MQKNKIMITGNEPAMPFAPKDPWNDESANGFSGLTKREYFAARAMAAILGNEDLRTKLLADKILDGSTNENYIAAYALKEVNNLIAELNKQ